jgi:hypothetical protein
MTKQTNKGGITVADNTDAPAPAAAEVETKTHEYLGVVIETRVGVQSGINFAGMEPSVAPAEDEAE